MVLDFHEQIPWLFSFFFLLLRFDTIKYIFFPRRIAAGSLLLSTGTVNKSEKQPSFGSVAYILCSFVN